MSNQPLAIVSAAQSAMKSGVINALGLMFAVGTLLPSVAQAPSDVRIALVIGNGAYAGTAALPNPANDAAAMSQTLKGLGFTVVEARDASRAQMMQAITTVRDNLKGRQGTGMLYYAGHGLQLDWRNYMVPVDAKISKAADVSEQTVELASVIDAFKQAGNKMNIVVLDACRDNPFPANSGKGLAQLDAPPGTFLAYATAPGNVAEDGAGQNGLYTSYLLEELKKPQAKIEDVFKRVRLNVRQKSQGRQIPWESTSLEEDFYFTGKKVELVNKTSEDASYRLQATLWKSLQHEGKPDDITEFLKQFPSGHFSELAQFRLDQLTKPNVVAVARPDDKLANNTLTRRAYVGTAKEMQFDNGDNSRRAKFINYSEVTRIDDKYIYWRDKFDNWGRPATQEGVIDLMGNPLGNSDVKREVPLQITPAEYRVGYRWKYSERYFNNDIKQEFTRDYESRIATKETVNTKIGDIEAFKIETTSLRSDGTTENSTRWVVPGELGTIKAVRRLYNNGRQIYYSNADIVSFKSGAPK
jgi:hypothetical protein